MPSFTITNIAVMDILRSVRHRPGTVNTEISTSMESGALLVDSFPAELTWRLMISFREELRSTITWAASVLDPNGVELAKFAPTSAALMPFPGEAELTLPSFIATVTGTYTVRLTIETPESSTFSVPISVGLR
jgi:hypothetical protein